MAESDDEPTRNRLGGMACRGGSECLDDPWALEVLSVIAGYKVGEMHVRAGQDIIAPGEPCDTIYHLVQGWAFLYSLLQDGRRQILHFALPGAVLGVDLAGCGSATYGVQALTESKLWALPHKSLRPLSKDHPEIGLELAWLAARDRNLTYDRLTTIAQGSARKRVAQLLLELFVRARAQWPGHRTQEMHLPLTQEHIGDATGLTSVHVNRVLSVLRDDGILHFHYRRLTILDPDRLVETADIEPRLARSWIGRR